MFPFILLLILLVLAITFFITYPIIKRLVLPEKFNLLCGRKIGRIAIRNKIHFLNNPKFQNYVTKPEKIDHILFGKKFIYLINDYCLLGEVNGSLKDSSWRYTKYREKSSSYIDNLVNSSNKNIQDFAGIINVNPEFIVSICVIPNECFLTVEGENSTRVAIVHYSSVNKVIKHFENLEIDDLNIEQFEQTYNLLNERNE